MINYNGDESEIHASIRIDNRYMYMYILKQL